MKKIDRFGGNALVNAVVGEGIVTFVEGRMRYSGESDNTTAVSK